MKHKFSFITALWWVLLLGFLGGMLIYLAPKEQRISENENRTLAGAPDLSWENIIDSSFMSGVESYFADGFFVREKMIGISSDIKGVFNIKSDEELMDVDMEEAVNEFMDEVEQENKEQGISDFEDEEQISADAQNEEISAEDADDATEQEEEYIFWLDYEDGTRRAFYTYSTKILDRSMEALNAYREALPEDGQLHFFQIPYGTLGNTLIQNEKSKCVGWACNAEDYMAQKADEGVYIHNGTEILEPYLLADEPLYYTTDYHWSALGAYYGLAGIREDMGLPYVEYDDYEYTVYDCYVGHGNKDNPASKAMVDRLEIMHPVLPVAESWKIRKLTNKNEIPYMQYNFKSYLAYLGSTVGPWRQIVTGAYTGRSCVVVTDSFGNAFTPYLFPYYDEVFVLDLRPAYYSRSAAGVSVREYIEYYGIDDAYIMLSTSSSMNSVYMQSYLLKYLD